MKTRGRRFWVEVSPRFAAPSSTTRPCGCATGRASSASPEPSASSGPSEASTAATGSVPRLTALAVAAGLDGAELDAELASVHRQRSSLAAYELGLIERKAALGARQPLPFAPVARAGSVADLLDEEEAAARACGDFVPEEVAVLLGTSVPSTRYHVDYALTLVREFPAVWHALADQRIDESAARAIVKALKRQAASWGGPVDDAIIDALAGCGVGWAERGCGPSALHDRLLAALIAADPAAADRRRETAKRGADAVVVFTGDGLGELRLLHVDIADLELARAQVDAYARAVQADGDERPIGQIRIAVILALIMRPWEARDPAVAHVTVNADLADLLLPDLEDLIPDAPTGQRSNGDGAIDGEAIDGEAIDGEATDGEATDGEATDGEATDGEATDGEATNDGATAVETADGEATGDGASAGEIGDVGTDTSTDVDISKGTGMGTGAGDVAANGAEPATDEDAAAEAPEAGHRETGEAEASDSECSEGSRRRPQAEGTGLPSGGAQVADVDGQAVSPAAVRELLRRIDALGLTHPHGGHLTFTITGTDWRLLAVATPEELEAAARTGQGIGPPPATPSYRPTAAQYRYLRARDRHCRFPGCRQTARTTEADHVIPYDHRNPTRGGPTCVTNLALLCKRHHQLKTHAPGWTFTLDPDGTLHVTTPGGTTRTTTPPATDQVLDLLDPAPPPHDPTADPPPF